MGVPPKRLIGGWHKHTACERGYIKGASFIADDGTVKRLSSISFYELAKVNEGYNDKGELVKYDYIDYDGKTVRWAYNPKLKKWTSKAVKCNKQYKYDENTFKLYVLYRGKWVLYSNR